MVGVETGDGPVVLGGDVGTSFAELWSGATEGQRLVIALGATTWLSHVSEPQTPEDSISR